MDEEHLYGEWFNWDVNRGYLVNKRKANPKVVGQAMTCGDPTADSSRCKPRQSQTTLDLFMKKCTKETKETETVKGDYVKNFGYAATQTGDDMPCAMWEDPTK